MSIVKDEDQSSSGMDDLSPGGHHSSSHRHDGTDTCRPGRVSGHPAKADMTADVACAGKPITRWCQSVSDPFIPLERSALLQRLLSMCATGHPGGSFAPRSSALAVSTRRPWHRRSSTPCRYPLPTLQYILCGDLRGRAHNRVKYRIRSMLSLVAAVVAAADSC